MQPIPDLFAVNLVDGQLIAIGISTPGPYLPDQCKTTGGENLIGRNQGGPQGIREQTASLPSLKPRPV